MLQVRKLSKAFDGLQAVKDLSLEALPGKITSLIGPNGAGKTTVFNMITGFLTPDMGDVRLNGNTISGLSPWQIARRGISRTFQNLRLFRKMTVQGNILLGIQRQQGEGFLNALISFSSHSPAHGASLKKVHELVEFVGLEQLSDELAENLSYGQQKLLSMACCLATEPTLLLLDEPVAGVQPEMIKKIENVLQSLVKNEGKTIFLIEHDIDFVLRVSDTIVVMDDGKKITEGVPDSIRSNSEILEAYLS
jgi:branched-chain amino acid transport system ATP-binding protein